MLPAGFEPAIRTRERPQTHALHHAATGIYSTFFFWFVLYCFVMCVHVRVCVCVGFVMCVFVRVL